MKKSICVVLMLLGSTSLFAQDNALTKTEKKEKWQLLFDGKTTTGWHNYLKPDVGSAWSVKYGELQLDPNGTDGKADLVTNDEYENFEFSVDWNISAEGNSGIIFLVHEDPQYGATYLTGPEYQLLDDAKAEDNKKPNHLAGSLYDMITPTKPAENPAGQWNHSVIRMKNGELTFWLNGVQTVQTHMWDDNWKQLVAGSKFADWKAFGTFHKGHIALQYHGHHIAFKNIKIKQL